MFHIAFEANGTNTDSTQNNRLGYNIGIEAIFYHIAKDSTLIALALKWHLIEQDLDTEKIQKYPENG